MSGLPKEVDVGAVSYTALTPLSFLERSARVWPGKVAVVYGSRRLTYAEVAAEAARVARALRASGVKPGDRVAYLMPNLPEMLIAHFAVPLAGRGYPPMCTSDRPFGPFGTPVRGVRKAGGR
jgi:acyl-CoA synthetase (AMP-forming)/AMP-acid ligase II